MYEKFNIDFKKYGINVSQILRASQAVPDQDLEIRGGGGVGGVRSSRSLKKGGPGLEKNIFRHFGPHFGGKIRGDPARVLFLVKPEFCQVPFSTTFRSFIDHHTHFCIFICSSKNKKIHI